MPHKPSRSADPWEAGVPVTSATVAGRYCAALAECPLDLLNLSALRAHAGLALAPGAETTWPALLAQILSADGVSIGTLIRLLSPKAPHDRVPILRPVRWFGDRRDGAALIMRLSKRDRRRHDVATLATRFDMAVSLLGLRYPSQLWAVDGLDHLAECDLPPGGKVVIVLSPGEETQPDSRVLIDRAMQRLRRGLAAGDVRLATWPPVDKDAA
jgi:hypothetical protein